MRSARLRAWVVLLALLAGAAVVLLCGGATVRWRSAATARPTTAAPANAENASVGSRVAKAPEAVVAAKALPQKAGVVERKPSARTRLPESLVTMPYVYRSGITTDNVCASPSLVPSPVMLPDRARLTEDERFVMNVTVDAETGAYTAHNLNVPTDHVKPLSGKLFEQEEAEERPEFEEAASQPSVVVILGSGGPIGKALAGAVRARGQYVLEIPGKLMIDLRDEATAPLTARLSRVNVTFAFLLAWDYRQPPEVNEQIVRYASAYLRSRAVPFVFFSTVLVNNKRWRFSYSKARAESVVLSAGGNYSRILRLPDVFGAEDWHMGDAKQHYVGRLLSKCVRGDLRLVPQDFRVDTMGIWRALMYVDDVAEAVAAAFFGKREFESLPLLISAIPEGEWLSVVDLAAAINDAWQRFRANDIADALDRVVDDCVDAPLLDALRVFKSKRWPEKWERAMMQLGRGPMLANETVLIVRPSESLESRLHDLLALYRRRYEMHLDFRSESFVRPYVSFVTGARTNASDMLSLLQVAINHIAHYGEVYQLSYELILVDWNAEPDKSLLKAGLHFPLVMRGRVRVITVPPSVHAKTGCPDDMLDMWAKNVGMRRARGEYVLNFAPDSLWNTRVFEAMALGRLRPSVIYLAHRLHARRSLPPRVVSTGPVGILEWIEGAAVAEDDETLRSVRWDLRTFGRNRAASRHVFRFPGDFVLAHRDAIAGKLRGFAETCYVQHTDTLFVYQGRRKGLSLSYMDGFLFHVHHPPQPDATEDVPQAMLDAADWTSTYAGMVPLQMERLARVDGDWGFRMASFNESVC